LLNKFKFIFIIYKIYIRRAFWYGVNICDS